MINIGMRSGIVWKVGWKIRISQYQVVRPGLPVSQIYCHLKRRPRPEDYIYLLGAKPRGRDFKMVCVIRNVVELEIPGRAGNSSREVAGNRILNSSHGVFNRCAGLVYNRSSDGSSAAGLSKNQTCA
jgi:hypothetical protein